LGAYLKGSRHLSIRTRWCYSAINLAEWSL